MEENTIVEYIKLRPRELVKKREETPVAYIGLGVLEWHGFQNPLGLDGLKADGVAIHLAKKIGGITMPPLYWGEVRSDLCELVVDPSVSKWLPSYINTDQTVEICKEMKLEKSDFLEDAKRSEKTGWELYERLLIRIFFQIETLGFKVIIPIPGHFPLIPPCKRAIEAYVNEGGKSKIFMLEDHMFADDGRAGDHAAKFETSIMMALYPELVDMNELDTDLSEPNLGVIGPDPREHASLEFGNEILEKFETIIRRSLKENSL